MISLKDAIRSLGGLAATHELYSEGFDRRTLAFAVNQGMIVRVRQGWYCTPDIDHIAQQAVRVGGRLGCISGGAVHGLWLPPDEHLHVSLAHNDCRLRMPNDMRRRLVDASDVTTHWNTRPRSGSRLLLDPLACLAEVASCQPIEYAVAIADSALRARNESGSSVISHGQWRTLSSNFPTRTGQLESADGVCESGTESVTWVRLMLHHLPIRRQVRIGAKRVDFLIGRRLVVEVDGAKYHIDNARFEADRTRDAELCALNYIVLRFSYNQVIYRWQEVESAVLAAVARGDHL